VYVLDQTVRYGLDHGFSNGLVYFPSPNYGGYRSTFPRRRRKYFSSAIWLSGAEEEATADEVAFRLGASQSSILIPPFALPCSRSRPAPSNKVL
ncbi:unnamed protein product, partial [Linum tenue]